MYTIKNKIAISIILFCFSISVFAEKDDFHLEAGLTGGVASYLGEANSNPLKDLTPIYGALVRYKYDSRFAARLEFNQTTIKGVKDTLAFNNRINMLDLCAEFNFFNVSKNKFAVEARTFSPYIFVGVGLLGYPYENEQQANFSIPLGLGFKLRLSNRINLNLQYTSRLMFKDDLEGVKQLNDPQGLNGSNFMNNDLLSNLSVGLTINFWEKKCKCVLGVN